MPVRIYSLAKDLNLDSKELVDICNRIGIPGKGSALASLEDEEGGSNQEARVGCLGSSGGAAQPAPERTAAPPAPTIPPAIPTRGGHFPNKPRLFRLGPRRVSRVLHQQRPQRRRSLK